MIARKFLFAQLAVVVLIYASHRIGMHYYDMSPNNAFFLTTHILGGIWVAFVIAWIRALQGKAPNIALGALAAFVIGVGWEIFEIAADLTLVTSLYYVPDTLGDIVADIGGGWLGGIIAVRATWFRRG